MISKNAVSYIIRLIKKIRLGWLIKKTPFLNRYEDYGLKPIPKYSSDVRKSVNHPAFGIDMFGLLQHAKITLNNHGEVAGEFAGNMRLFEATGVGSCLLTDNKKNMEDLFIINEEVVVYNGFDDCVEKIKWLLNNESERSKIAKAGQARTLNTHSVENRCKLLIEIISKELSDL